MILENDDATIKDLKEALDEEHGIGEPERQNLFYLGLPISENDLIVKEIIELYGNEFNVSLPLAAENETERFLVIPKSSSDFKTIDLQTKLNQELFKFVSKNGVFGISYKIEGNELGRRIFHVDLYKVSKKATELRFTPDFKVFQVFKDGNEEQILGELNVYDENQRISRLDKHKKISEIFGNYGSFLSGIFGLVKI